MFFLNDLIFSGFYDVKISTFFNNEIFSGFYDVKILIVLMIFMICDNFVKFYKKS